MPKFVAIHDVSSYMGGEDKKVSCVEAKDYKAVLKQVFAKRNPPLKRNDYKDDEEYEDDVEYYKEMLEEWIDCTDKLAPGVWEMVYDDTGITIVKVG